MTISKLNIVLAAKILIKVAKNYVSCKKLSDKQQIQVSQTWKTHCCDIGVKSNDSVMSRYMYTQLQIANILFSLSFRHHLQLPRSMFNFPINILIRKSDLVLKLIKYLFDFLNLFFLYFLSVNRSFLTICFLVHAL